MNLRDFQLRWVATAAMVTALAVPAAAQARPDELGGRVTLGSPASVETPSVGSPALNDRVHSPATGSAAASHPDGWAIRFAPGGSDTPSIPVSHPDNRAGVRGPNRAAFVAAASGTGSFDWSDAGIGAGTALALMLAAAGSVLLLRQRRTGLAI